MIDFIIPHMGRTEMLLDTIESITKQNAFNSVGQIIVVSRNKEAPTLPDIDKLTLIHEPDVGSISEQRNRGVMHSNEEFLAFLDADIELSPNWVTQCMNEMESRANTVIVSAQQKIKRAGNLVETLRCTLSNVATDCEVSFLPGRNLLIRRTHHDEIGGFPEHLQTCEDYYYTDKAAKLGALYYTAQTFYYHLGEDLSLSQTFKKEIWRSEYNLLSLKGRDVPLSEWPSILLPFWVLLFTVVALVGFFYTPLFLLGIVGMLTPPLLYSARLSRYRPTDLPKRFIILFYCIYFVARTLGTVSGSRFIFRKEI